MPRSIDVDDATRSRFRDAARAQGVDENAIARRAGLSRRVVREVLAGQRTRITTRSYRRLEHALLGAPAVAPLPVHDAGARRWLPRVIAAVAFAAVAAAAWWALRPSPQPVIDFACEARSVGVRDARNGRTLVEVSFAERVAFAFLAPWPDTRMVLYGTMNDGRAGGRLGAFDAASGERLWSLGIPREDATRHFPPAIAETGRFKPMHAWTGSYDCTHTCVADFDGDGSDDIALKWVFEPWYPGCVTWYSRDPARPRRLVERGRYFTCGAVGAVVVHDIDGDGRPGLIAGGTNNASGYQGAMLTFLDAAHWSGGSVDAVSAATHWRNPPGLSDGSRARVVFPQFEDAFMEALGFQRLDVAYAVVSNDTIEFGIGLARAPVVVVRMDPCLDVIDARATAAAEQALALAPPALRARFLAGYVAEWAARRVRFGDCLR